MLRAALALGIHGFAACAGPSAPATAPVAPPSPPPRGAFVRTAELVLGEDVGAAHDVVVVDGGRRAVLVSRDTLALVDLDAPALLAPPLTLSSASVPTGLARPYAPVRGRKIMGAWWAWDERRSALTGVLLIQSAIQAAAGLGVWEPAGERAPRMLDANTKSTPLALSADGNTLLTRSSSDDINADSVQLFDLRSGHRAGASIQTGIIASAAFSPDGSKIALGLSSGVLAILTPSTRLTRSLNPGVRHEQPFRRAAFHPTLPLLIVDDGVNARVWNFGGKTPTSIDLPVAPVFTFSPDGRYLAVGRIDRVELLDVATLARVGAPYQPVPHRGRLYQLAFSPDGRRLVALWDQRVLSVLDLGAIESAAPARWFATIQPLAVPDPEQPPPFERDGEVTGRVYVDKSVVPVIGAVVQLRPSPHEWPEATALPVLETRTGADGQYAFTGVPRVDWRVTVRVPRHLSVEHAAYLRSKQRVVVAVPVIEGRTITGKIVGVRGKVAGTQVRVVSLSARAESSTTTVGRDGRFAFEQVAPGLGAAVWAQGPDGSAGFAAVPGTGPVETATVKLQPRGSAGVVRVRTVSPTGAPVPGVRLTLLARPTHHAVTAADGTYTFVVPPSTTYLNIHVWVGPEHALRNVPHHTPYERPFPHDVEIMIPDAPP